MIRVATAPVSWGIYEFEGLEPKYPYTRVLDEIAQTGYTGLELGPWGYLPTDPDTLRPELEGRRLRLLSSYVPCRFADANAVEATEAQALAVARLLASQGAECVVLADDNGSVPELTQRAGSRAGQSALSADEWDRYAAGVDRVARAIDDQTGLRSAFHHHCAGYVETAEEVRELLRRTDPARVGLCLDTGHWHYAGGNAVTAIEEYGDRVTYLHFKDCDPTKRRAAIDGGLDYFGAVASGVFCELGRGEVDFARVIQLMTAQGYDGWAIVEQDVLVSDLEAPRQSARRNREYLRSLGL